MENKIKTREEIIKICDKLRKAGKKIVSTNGSFDILHYGHIKYLEEAKRQGDVLIIGLNTDDSVRRWKKHIGYKDWDKRPLNNQTARAGMLAALECVDYVNLFDETDCLKFVESVKPDVHVNGSEYGENCIEAETVKKYGGKVYIIKIIEGYSTSSLIKKIKDMKDD
ncbi:MAG: adenylyltransferase/cytidyltransferase family protein [Candidatus Nanoarchaeia archaeon]|nr:adenylyltransferase/cytidyltransferase family protein [Candidatus Nanoarchaeia archaeon]